MEKIKREGFVRKLYSDINYGKDYDILNPDVKLIESAIEDVPTGSLSRFYSFMYDGEDYVNKNTGIIMKGKIQKASRDFMAELKSELWKNYNLSEKVELFISKIFSLKNFNDGSGRNIVDIINDLDLTRMSFKKENGEKEPLSSDEIEIIRNNNKTLIFIDINTLSSTEYREKIAMMFKTLYTKKYLSRKIIKNQIGNSNEKRVVSLVKTALSLESLGK